MLALQVELLSLCTKFAQLRCSRTPTGLQELGLVEQQFKQERKKVKELLYAQKEMMAQQEAHAAEADHWRAVHQERDTLQDFCSQMLPMCQVLTQQACLIADNSQHPPLGLDQGCTTCWLQAEGLTAFRAAHLLVTFH